MKTRTLFAAFALALLSAFLALPISGCATLGTLLPDVLAYVSDGTQVLDAIDRFVQTYFTAHGVAAEERVKYTEAMATARSSLNSALRATQGVKDLNDQKVDEAFADFKAAYLELMKVAGPFGVKPATGVKAFRAVPGGGLEVPEPLAFHPKKAK